jgi:hypothetical protein
MTIKKSHLNKLIIAASLGTALWGVVAWLFITVPLFVVNALPNLLPLAVFAFLLFLAGLLLLVHAAASVVRIAAPRYTWTVILAAAFLIVVYNLTPLAPAWNCFSKRVYVSVVKAGSNCTTICTNNDKKPCGGWSSCWDKDISCSASGIDQDGRPCQGCCFSCDVVCEPEESDDQPPTISASKVCSQIGNNGWCVGPETITFTATDPQGYSVTISGDIGGTAFTCTSGATSCTKTLPEGNGTINYKVTASTSGMTDQGSKNWKRDVTPPIATLVISAPTGSNGWFKTSPVTISVSGSDALSGLAVARLSLDPNANSTTWPSSISLSSDGTYVVWYGADDVAGNRRDYSGKYIYIDTTPPTLTSSFAGTLGANGWYISQAVVSTTSMDATSGVYTVLISDNGGAGKPSPVTLGNGVHNLTITATDIAGNSESISQTVYVDLDGPTITPSISGTSGLNGWYVSNVNVDAIASDAISGIQGSIEISLDNGTTWSDLPINLPEGNHALLFRALDVAGNKGTASLNTSVDTTSPSLSFVYNGTRGSHSWYVSNVEVLPKASDALSGMNTSAVRADGGAWSSAVTLSDGTHTIDAQAEDIAGNTKSITDTLRVDTLGPTSVFNNNHETNEVILGTISIGGQSSDSGSGVQFTEVSIDGGITWQAAMLSGDTWSYIWDTTTIPNGIYTVLVRSTDSAGNLEKPTSSITLIVDNLPPSVKITDWWWIWQSGEYKVSENSFAISEIKVTISDPENRWSPRVITYKPSEMFAAITWDRRFPGGIVAPWGNYNATVLACDIYGNCASDKGQIKIPILASVPASATPSPTAMPTITPTITASPIPATPMPTQTQVQIISTVEVKRPQPNKYGITHKPMWVIIVLSLLVLLFGTEALLDPRPKALRSLAKTINQFTKE